MRDTLWMESMVKMAIAVYLLSMTACRPPSPSPSPTDTSQQLPPPVNDQIIIPPSSTASPLQDSNPQATQTPTNQSTESLPTLPTTPIESLPDFEPPKTITSTSASTPSDPKDVNRSQYTKDILTKGTFVSGEHPTEGSIIIVDDEGTPVIEFEQDFQTANGPDLVIVLHRASNPLANTHPPAYSLQDGDYVELAPLKANQGKQHYSIPAAIILENYNSVAIWCRTFNATFGVASLQ